MRNLLLALCAASVAVSCGGGSSEPEAITIELTGNDQMQYDKNTLTVPAGAEVTVKVKNIGTMAKEMMAHNFVLLVSGVTAQEFGTACAVKENGATAENSYIPTAENLVAQIVAYTPGQAGPGETVEVTFTAPASPGSHEYLCTFPGHWAVMRGVLTVQ